MPDSNNRGAQLRQTAMSRSKRKDVMQFYSEYVYGYDELGYLIYTDVLHIPFNQYPSLTALVARLSPPPVLALGPEYQSDS